MCINLPVKVIAVENKKIIVRENNRQKEVRGSLIKIKAGDCVILQNNFIVWKINKKEAKEIFNLVKK